MENSPTIERQWLLKEKHHGIESPAFLGDLKRLAAGEPLAYIIGHVPFLDVTIHLDSHPLIPRAETEYWAEVIITEMKMLGRSIRVLDLCAGSGAIGVAVLKAISNTYVDFAEIDTAHHPTIQKNISALKIDSARTHIFSGNLFERIVPNQQYDYILTNPPYINPSLRSRTEKSVLAHEPHRALFGGKDGMEFITRIIADAPNYLAPSGTLFIEHEPEQQDAIAHLASTAHYAQVETVVDQWGKNRCTRLLRTP